MPSSDYPNFLPYRVSRYIGVKTADIIIDSTNEKRRGGYEFAQILSHFKTNNEATLYVESLKENVDTLPIHDSIKMRYTITQLY
jgi:hypothetical protein